LSGANGPALEAALYRHPQDATIVASASRRLFRVNMPPEALVDGLVMRGSNGHGAAKADDDLDGVIAALRADGCLGAAPGTADWLRFDGAAADPDATARTSLLIVGEGRLASLLASLLDGRDLLGRFPGTSRGELAALDRPLDRSSVVVAVGDHFDYGFLTDIEDRASAGGFRWIPLHVDAGKGWMGPAITPGEGPGYRDVMRRRLCAAPSVPLFHALTGRPVHGRPHLPPDPELRWMLSILLIELERWVAGVPVASWWHEVELDPMSFTLTPHPVLPMPDRATKGSRHFDVEVFVDERTGIVNRIAPTPLHPSVPGQFRMVQTIACDLRQATFRVNNRCNHGSSFVSERAARAAAIGECIERYCGDWIDPDSLVRASYDELVMKGDRAIDPLELVLFSPAQHAVPGFPFVPFTRDLRVNWIRGRSLSLDRDAWLPASLVHFSYHIGPFAFEPRTNFPPYSGVAAGPTWDAAVTSALEELIERDATMIWWLNAQPLAAVQLTPDLAAVWAGRPAELGQRAWLIHLDNEFDVPVMAGVLENAREGLFAVGFAARPDPVQAGLKAWAEAIALQQTQRLLDDPESGYWTTAAALTVDDRVKPHRPDRRYLDSYRADFHDVTALMAQIQITLDPRAREASRRCVDVPETRSLGSIPHVADRTSASYRERLERRGFEVFAVDLTTSDVAATDMKVARVIVPGLVPNTPAAFQPFGRGRVQQAAVTLGWRDRPLEEEALNTFPLPHA
jgi:ribosomal protein S12 methylthiotransferase accessory factor